MYLQEKRDFQEIYQAWDTPQSIFDELRGVSSGDEAVSNVSKWF